MKIDRSTATAAANGHLAESDGTTGTHAPTKCPELSTPVADPAVARARGTRESYVEPGKGTWTGVDLSAVAGGSGGGSPAGARPGAAVPPVVPAALAGIQIKGGRGAAAFLRGAVDRVADSAHQDAPAAAAAPAGRQPLIANVGVAAGQAPGSPPPAWTDEDATKALAPPCGVAAAELRKAVDGLLRHFQAVDRDGDGAIRPGELEAAAQNPALPAEVRAAAALLVGNDADRLSVDRDRDGISRADLKRAFGTTAGDEVLDVLDLVKSLDELAFLLDKTATKGLKELADVLRNVAAAFRGATGVAKLSAVLREIEKNVPAHALAGGALTVKLATALVKIAGTGAEAVGAAIRAYRNFADGEGYEALKELLTLLKAAPQTADAVVELLQFFAGNVEGGGFLGDKAEFWVDVAGDLAVAGVEIAEFVQRYQELEPAERLEKLAKLLAKGVAPATLGILTLIVTKNPDVAGLVKEGAEWVMGGAVKAHDDFKQAMDGYYEQIARGRRFDERTAEGFTRLLTPLLGSDRARAVVRLFVGEGLDADGAFGAMLMDAMARRDVEALGRLADLYQRSAVGATGEMNGDREVMSGLAYRWWEHGNKIPWEQLSFPEVVATIQALEAAKEERRRKGQGDQGWWWGKITEGTAALRKRYGIRGSDGEINDMIKEGGLRPLQYVTLADLRAIFEQNRQMPLDWLKCRMRDLVESGVTTFRLLLQRYPAGSLEHRALAAQLTDLLAVQRRLGDPAIRWEDPSALWALLGMSREVKDLHAQDGRDALRGGGR
ncbi:MAG: EF-hand domain-containing protein [Candidatus Schekmanbacteria bacterium]|nr:EF-hand domain-containing protein [Candidatus Schekmanbacteria bacterium]